MKHLQTGPDRQSFLQLGQVFDGDRHGGRVEGGRRSPLVFAGLRIDLVRDANMRHDPGKTLGQPLLVLGIGIGVEQTDGDALHLVRLEPRDQPVDLAVGERRQHRSGMIEPLDDAEAEGRRHQRGRLRRNVEAVEFLPAVAGDLKHVLETGGGDKRHFRQALLHQRIGHACRAVDEAPDVVGAETDRRQRLHHRPHRRIGARGHLGDAGLVTAAPDGDDVGEGAPDVGADVPQSRLHVVMPPGADRRIPRTH